MFNYFLNFFSADPFEAHKKYLSESVDLCDLERRQKQLLYGMKDWRTL